VSVITAQRIEDQNLVTVADALSNVTGITVVPNDGTQSQYRSRGYALTVMNDILGGGGFTSRITKTVRSNEGLAYHASSSFGIGTWFPTDFSIDYQSKNPTVALAAKLAIEEVNKIRDGKVGQDELDVSKNGYIDSFPRRFDSKAAIVALWANDDYIGRPHAYWDTWRDNIRKVTADDFASLHARLRGGTPAVLILSAVSAAPDDPSTITLHCEQGALRLVGEELLLGRPRQPFHRIAGSDLAKRDGNSPGGAFGTGTLLLARALRAALDEGNRDALSPAATFEDGLAQQRVLDAARRSATGGGGWERV